MKYKKRDSGQDEQIEKMKGKQEGWETAGGSSRSGCAKCKKKDG